jgi:indole-3-glycerol phosphate synthase/phosphoribosylanthranilate isomerase
MTILEEITEKRRSRLKKEGPGLGVSIPSMRNVPLVPFGRPPFMICEIKRRSPSKGIINGDLDAVTQAGIYIRAGAKSISVLTEQDHFGGSLSDLIEVKKKYPEISILRKDFLLDEEDIETAYLCGADAVLLIAGILEEQILARLYDKAVSLGMTALVEVHDKFEIYKVRSVKPELLGMNCRDLKTFKMDLLGPLPLIPEVDWACRKVFESGLFDEADSAFVKWAGFDGILVGEALVRNPSSAAGLLAGLQEPKKGNFWSRLAVRSKPWVKICGITNEADAQAAMDAGADILGFVFASSPRRADFGLLRKLQRMPILKVGVVVENTEGQFEPEVLELLEKGLLDAVQMHGSGTPQNIFHGYPFYKALRPMTKEELLRINDYRCPRILIDAFHEKEAGGTGTLIDPSIVSAASDKMPLWLAGGLTPVNVKAIVETYHPELLDVSSGVEKSKGIKDHSKVIEFIREVKNG